MCDLGDKPFREVIDHAMNDFLSDDVRRVVEASVEAWFKENKHAMRDEIRERLKTLCAEHVTRALYDKVSKVVSEFERELKEEFGKQLRKEAEDVMKGHWNAIKARFIRAINDRERIEAMRFGAWPGEVSPGEQGEADGDKP